MCSLSQGGSGGAGRTRPEGCFSCQPPCSLHVPFSEDVAVVWAELGSLCPSSLSAQPHTQCRVSAQPAGTEKPQRLPTCGSLSRGFLSSPALPEWPCPSVTQCWCGSSPRAPVPADVLADREPRVGRHRQTAPGQVLHGERVQSPPRPGLCAENLGQGGPEPCGPGVYWLRTVQCLSPLGGLGSG